jgi:ABC-2 type transport system permease protein
VGRVSSGVRTIVKKELADHFASYRFLILFALIAMASLTLVLMAASGIEESVRGSQAPRFVFLMLFTTSKIQFSLVQFVAFFGPLIGLILGFDAINRERNEGTLSKLLAQPIYRDSVINGKFLAGVFVITVMMTSIVLLITGMGLLTVGVKPGVEELWRILVYLVISIVYISLWLGVAILFSILFRSIATSALAALAVWVFFSFFLALGVNALITALLSGGQESAAASLPLVFGIEKTLSFTSPMMLYTDSTAAIVDPLRRTLQPFIVQMGAMEKYSLTRFSGPLPFGQSMLIAGPYLIFLIAITVICFAISYIVFMRQEIRSV